MLTHMTSIHAHSGGKARLFGFLTLIVVTFFFSSLAQASEKSAQRVVEKVNGKIEAMLANYPMRGGQTNVANDQIKVALAALMREHFNMQAISQTVLGPAWRRASQEQRNTFTDVFTDYLAEKYSSRFPDLVGAELEITQTKELKKNHYVVYVRATFGQRVENIEYYVLRHAGQSKVVNLALASNNILNLEAKVIRSLLSQRSGDLDRLNRELPFRYTDS